MGLKTEHAGSKKGRGAYWGQRQEAKQLSRKQRRFGDKLTHQRLIELGLEAPKPRSRKKPKKEAVPPEYSVGETVYVRPEGKREGLLEVLIVDYWESPGNWRPHNYFGIVQRTTNRSLDYLVGHIRHIEERPFFGDQIIGRDSKAFELALKHKR